MEEDKENRESAEIHQFWEAIKMVSNKCFIGFIAFIGATNIIKKLIGYTHFNKNPKILSK